MVSSQALRVSPWRRQFKSPLTVIMKSLPDNPFAKLSLAEYGARLRKRMEALAESWREESHEEELAAAGEITADYRTA